MPSREYIRLGTRVIAIENIPPAVAAPTFSPAGGNYNVAQTVTISTSTAGATIRYTLDGTTPTETNGTVGTSVTVSSTATLRAIAYENGMTDSAVSSANYVITDVVSQPTAPSGPTSVITALAATYCTGGSTDSFGSSVQYQFNWGDGTTSGWLASGTTCASQAWSSAGVKSVTAQARSATNTAVVSAPSSPLNVTLTQASATLSITKTSFLTTEPWTLTLTTNLPANSSFTWCATHNGASLGCNANYGTTVAAANGSTWTVSGNFGTAEVGSWQEWLYFPGVVQSNTISFTVTAATINFFISPPNATPTTSFAFSDFDSWVLKLSTNVPDGTSFSICATHNGSNLGCNANYGTVSGGAWTQNGVFNSSVDGSWTEWLLFPGNVTSPTISFTISPPSAYLQITATSFNVNGNWTVTMTTNLHNFTFNYCGIFNGGMPGCNLNYGTTDPNTGGWSTSGVFDASTVGSWEEWAQFPTVNNMQSNHIYFTVSP
jgi:hypothetical protein